MSGAIPLFPLHGVNRENYLLTSCLTTAPLPPPVQALQCYTCPLCHSTVAQFDPLPLRQGTFHCNVPHSVAISSVTLLADKLQA